MMGIDSFDTPTEIPADVLSEAEGGTATVPYATDDTPGLVVDGTVSTTIVEPDIDLEALDLSGASPRSISLNFHGPQDMTFTVSVDGPKATISCTPPQDLTITHLTDTSVTGQALESGSHSLTCQVAISHPVSPAELAMPILMTALITGAPPDGPTSAQNQAPIRQSVSTMSWDEYPDRDWPFTMQTEMKPMLREESTPAQAFQNAGNNTCQGTEAHVFGCVMRKPWNDRAHVLARLRGTFNTVQGLKEVQCQFLQTPVQSTDPNGNVHTTVVDAMAYAGAITAAADGYYVSFKDYANAPKQSAALKAFSDGIKEHEQVHLADNKTYVETDVKQVFQQKLVGETLAILKSRYSLFKGLFTATANQVNFNNQMSANDTCIGIVRSVMTEAKRNLLGRETDAYVTINGIRRLRANMPLSPLGRLAWRIGTLDLSERGSLCFLASEDDPAQNDPVSTNGCSPQTMHGEWISTTLRGVLRFLAHNHLVYTYEQTQ